MQQQAIIQALKHKKKAKGWTLRNIEKLTGVNYVTAGNILGGKNGGLYQLLDLVEGMGLEIRQEGTIKALDHGGLLKLLDQHRGVKGMQLKQISERAGVDHNAVGRMFKGDNVQLTTFFKTLEAMGIELTII